MRMMGLEDSVQIQAECEVRLRGTGKKFHLCLDNWRFYSL